MGGANGPRPTWRRLHLRLDREHPRPRHAQRRSRLARIPAPAARRHDRPGLQPDAHRARRARARPRLALGRRQLGLDVRGRGARRTDTPHQPQPIPASEADRAHRDAPDGAWIPRDGTQDAARDQAAWRGPGVGANYITDYRANPRFLGPAVWHARRAVDPAPAAVSRSLTA